MSYDSPDTVTDGMSEKVNKSVFVCRCRCCCCCTGTLSSPRSAAAWGRLVLQPLTTTFVLQAEAADLQVKSDSRRLRGVTAPLCSPLTAAVSAHQYPAFKSSDTENFSLGLDMDEEDDLSTDEDEDEDVSFPPVAAAAAQLLPPPVSLTKFHHLFFFYFFCENLKF